VQLDVRPSSITQIARLSSVLWIERMEPKVMRDENQDLILADQTNGPGHSPIPVGFGGISYLDFLTNTVGGGLPSFEDPNTYPIVDVADTGFDTSIADSQSPIFFEFGDTNMASRVVYRQPNPYFEPHSNNGDIEPASVDLGCPRLNVNFDGWEDFSGHGTEVASVLSGYDQRTNISFQCIEDTYVLSNFTEPFGCFGNGPTTTNLCFPTQPSSTCTQITVACLGTNDCHHVPIYVDGRDQHGEPLLRC
jgi:hypothetical protein